VRRQSAAATALSHDVTAAGMPIEEIFELDKD
jgi:hypothetical protein